jgi:hypothetical protein
MTETGTPGFTLTPSPGPSQAPTAAPALEIIKSLPLPNPQGGEFINLALHLSAPCESLRIRLYSAATTLVWEGSAPGLPGGWNQAQFRSPSLAQGLYFYRLEAQAQGQKAASRIGKLLILK